MSGMCQPCCECRGCKCPSCPTVRSKPKHDFSYVCDHGTKPKCDCNTKKRSKRSHSDDMNAQNLCMNDTKQVELCPMCNLDEPEPIPDPERTRSFMKIVTFEKCCICKIVTRALKADVHRYLGLNRDPPTREYPPGDIESIDSTCSSYC